jgi:hypothetical protein
MTSATVYGTRSQRTATAVAVATQNSRTTVLDGHVATVRDINFPVQGV